jgi:flagellar protein FliS
MPINQNALRYQEVKIKTATPLELVVMLYDAAIADLKKAQEHIATRNIAARTRCLNKVMSILTELQANLNFEAGGDIASSLNRLYRYMQDRIFQANLQQSAESLKEIVGLLIDLRTAWAEISLKQARENTHAAGAARGASHAALLPLAAASEGRSSMQSLNLTA